MFDICSGFSEIKVDLLRFWWLWRRSKAFDYLSFSVCEAVREEGEFLISFHYFPSLLNPKSIVVNPKRMSSFKATNICLICSC
ncbi:hypothetical protein BUALT_Bualt06G0098000 [Buddleja alternifolia]|uniref:Uncharacterized protein n=1 Tax=Buddleja alternifolia TaxID=168488 RepID=A0AAV6XPV4_9LAMI|nr:hypothetical protein BUALT_Bualt06G0098000 [Buddleja alternifolia]